MLGMIAQAAGSLGGDLLSYYGQKEANQMSRDSAREATWASSAEAEKNRQWQEQMSNSAHQREVADLKKAGINPLLTAGGSGSSTPGGATGAAQSYTASNTLQGVGASAREAARLAMDLRSQKAELENMQKTGKNIDADTQKKIAERKALGIDAMKGEAAQSIWSAIKEKFSGPKRTGPLKYNPPKDGSDAASRLPLF